MAYFWTMSRTRFSYLRVQLLGVPCLVLDEQRGSFRVEWVAGVGVVEELRKEHFEDVLQVVHGGPGLVDDIETHRSGSKYKGQGSYASSILGWNILVTKPMLGDL